MACAVGQAPAAILFHTSTPLWLLLALQIHSKNRFSSDSLNVLLPLHPLLGLLIADLLLTHSCF